MSDDWNLKDKGMRGYPDGGITGFYTKETLETLRNKLIEDIDTIDCTETSKLTKWEMIEEVLKIIDKRFGFKDE